MIINFSTNTEAGNKMKTDKLNHLMAPIIRKYVIYDIEQGKFVTSGATRVDVTKASSYAKLENAVLEGIYKATKTGNPNESNYEIVSVDYSVVGIVPREKWSINSANTEKEYLH